MVEKLFKKSRKMAQFWRHSSKGMKSCHRHVDGLKSKCGITNPKQVQENGTILATFVERDEIVSPTHVDGLKSKCGITNPKRREILEKYLKNNDKIRRGMSDFCQKSATSDQKFSTTLLPSPLPLSKKWCQQDAKFFSEKQRFTWLEKITVISRSTLPLVNFFGYFLEIPDFRMKIWEDTNVKMA